MQVQIKSPLSVFLPRKTMPPKKIILNLNVYHRLHFQTYALAKIEYCKAMERELDGLKLKPPIRIEFILHKGNKQKSDRSNVLCIVEKYFCDALTHYGCITDDNDTIISETAYYSGSQNKDDPHVEVVITEVRD